MIMAKARGNSNNGAASAPEQTTPEAQPEQAAGPEASHDGGPEAPSADEPPQPDPHPADYADHSGPRLMSEQDADVTEAERLRALLAPIEWRIEKRGAVIAERLIAKAKVDRKPNPTVTFGGIRYQPKARSAKIGGGFALVRYTEREETSFI
jgi:hypothetical protein